MSNRLSSDQAGHFVQPDLGPNCLNRLFTDTFLQKIFLEIPVSNRLGPDQARHLVRPHLGPNCLSRLLADDTFLNFFS